MTEHVSDAWERAARYVDAALVAVNAARRALLEAGLADCPLCRHLDVLAEQCDDIYDRCRDASLRPVADTVDVTEGA